MSEIEALAHGASQDVAFTHRCKPRRGFRCWQYTQDVKAIPFWVLEHVNAQGNGKLEYCDEGGSTNCLLDPGDWIVVYDEGAGISAVYSEEDFTATFEAVQE